jgi:hypothetical protein
MKTQQERITSNLLSNMFDQHKRLSHSVGAVNGMLKVKLGRPALKLLFLVVPVLGIKKNIGIVKVLITFASFVYRLMRKGGVRFAVIYLKACSTLLQQSIGGQVILDTGPFGSRVSRTRGGLPRVIPAIHRKRIRNGELLIIRLWLSLFALYRVIDLAGKVNLASIRDPSTADLSLEGEFKEFISLFWGWISMKWPVPGSIALAVKAPVAFLKTLAIRPFLSFSSGPILSGTLSSAAISGRTPAVTEKRKEKQELARLSSFSALGILLAAHLWREPQQSLMMNSLLHWCLLTWNFDWWGHVAIGWKPQSKAINSLVDYIQRPETVVFNPKSGELKDEKDLSEKELESKNWKRLSWKLKWFLGKLGFKQEAAGKVRVFAMVDPITQWLLKPLHDAIFRLLQVIPADGTFDQAKPLDRLLERQRKLRQGRMTSAVKKTTSLFSFDLSSATDRLPVIFQRWLLEPVITIAGASHWVTFLVGRSYFAPNRPDVGLRTTMGGISVKYGAGQPMGALSSWAMLALTHHCIVQWAWWRVCKELGQGYSWYAFYAILGDDVVIMGDRVARAYVKIIRSLGVTISEHKSLVSRGGRCLEFAKRTYLDGANVSAVPFLELQAAKGRLGALLELVNKYKLSLGEYLSFIGYGYKAKASASGQLTRMPYRLRNYLVVYYGPGSPLFTGILGWLSMRTIGTQFEFPPERMDDLKSEFIRREKSKLRDLFDRMRTVFSKAIEFWGPPVLVDSEGYALPGQRSVLSLVSSKVDDDVVNRIDTDIYAPIRNRTLRKAFEVQSRVMGLDSESSFSELDALWDACRELDGDLGALPMPSDRVVAKIRSDLARPKSLRMWEAYSDLVRSISRR